MKLAKSIKDSKEVQGLGEPVGPSSNVEMRMIQLGADLDDGEFYLL